MRNRNLARWKFRRQHPSDETARDAERTCILDSLGFRVVRVTNIDVYENLEGVLEVIYRELHTD